MNGANAIAFAYDDDGLLNLAGAETLVPNPTNGLLDSTTLGVVNDSYLYNGFGEIKDYDSTISGTSKFAVNYVRDKLGRIDILTETIDGSVHKKWDFDYDTAGRLDKITDIQGTPVLLKDYEYDDNGNRVSEDGGTTTIASYDNQDRLQDYNGTTYTYTDNGELLTKVDGSGTTEYTYDVLGNLIKVNPPGTGNDIEYIIDGRNRRIGKKVNGILVKAWLYQDQLNPIAELDGNGTVVSRFVYGSKANVPDYMIKGGVTYRIISDHLGSPRYVIDTSTGLVAQQMEYDEWGNVIVDSPPNFQPFAFAGGLYDTDTELVHFGARDYDPEIGRWTNKDPIRFDGDGTNLYGYVDSVGKPSLETNLYSYAFQDPINFIDFNGLWSVSVGAYAGLGGTLTFGSNNGKNFVSLDVGVGLGGRASFNPLGDYKRPEDSETNCKVEGFFGFSGKAGLKFGRWGVGESGYAGKYVSLDSDGKLSSEYIEGTSPFGNVRSSGYGIGAIIQGGLSVGVAW